ncbi:MULTISPECIES: PTS sugar transporter subunit IIA [unclassified Pseudoclavibacter]|uniref:PTS sugar transporter subunit IIA n=1 Tax=unclassified Pseudoclavibacter TaxID=2615177 RepID=UPI0015E368CC|nr:MULTISPECIES: PTS sugar transporter subunit IIA [unclassified Pseudoclavibacter]
MAEVLSLDSIRLGGTARTREEAITEAGELLVAAGAVTQDYIQAMHDREQSVSTFMGNYLAIPHGTNEAKDTILGSALSVVRYDEPIDWGGNETRFVIGIAGKDGGHLEILSSVAIVFSDEDNVEALLKAETPEELAQLLGDVNEE